jgi:hypothetical protein
VPASGTANHAPADTTVAKLPVFSSSAQRIGKARLSQFRLVFTKLLKGMMFPFGDNWHEVCL